MKVFRVKSHFSTEIVVASSIEIAIKKYERKARKQTASMFAMSYKVVAIEEVGGLYA